jgi:hypothetical protein
MHETDPNSHRFPSRRRFAGMAPRGWGTCHRSRVQPGLSETTTYGFQHPDGHTGPVQLDCGADRFHPR